MEFCPMCGAILQIEPQSYDCKMRFFCAACPYVCAIGHKLKKKQHLVKKELDAIMSWEDTMKSAEKTSATCPACHNGTAYCMQMQIRSADEPMTTFYTCCDEKCRHQWRED